MQNLEILSANAFKAYNAADQKGKELLEHLFGSNIFNRKIIERIDSWEAACDEIGIDPEESLPFKNPFKTARQEAINAFFQLDIIAEVLREGVILDWTNSNQKKWYAWFNDYKPGSGFSFDVTDCAWTRTAAAGGARLCVDTDEKARYFGTQFLPIWNKFLNPNQ